MFALFFLKLFVLCGLGTLLEIASDKCLNSIQYCEWHLLPVQLQRNLQLMLLRAQHMPHLMAGTTPLNLDTFVNVSVAFRLFARLCVPSNDVVFLFSVSDGQEYLFVDHDHGRNGD